eukprot:TRINITY_DN39824_c0_g2_i1.p1 TRINITY_DN39824_c0_g2~~TRINITY_DN39824_c0_g2_i1.p1  ORF type:complete len:498 (+),score=66.50 TRINITY_DN39824_c0_g2_i1:221-1495(+)
MTWELLVLAQLLIRGLVKVDGLPVPTRIALESVVFGYMINSVCNITFGFLTYNRATDLPKQSFLLAFAKREVCSLLFLLIVVNFESAETGYEKVMIALNIIVRCFLLFAMMRVLPVIGPLIIAVVSSFFPMLGMFSFMLMVFAMFAAAFIMFRDENRSAAFVLLYVYQALFLTDRDAAEAISALDAAKEQTLDFHTEIYTGSGDPWLENSSNFVSLVSTSIFSLVLMNLTVGMYTKFYEEMEPLAELILRHQRVRMCVGFMLSPSWWWHSYVRSLVGSAGSQDGPWGERASLLSAIILCVMYVSSVFMSTTSLVPSFVLALLKQAVQVMFIAKIAPLFSDDSENYLWISHRADYDADLWHSRQSTNDLRREMMDFRSEYQRTCHAMDDKLEHLAQDVQETSRNIHEIHKHMATLLSLYGVDLEQ